MKKESELHLEVGDLVVYPIYGVGEVENFDKYEIDGNPQDFILINFKQDKMKLRIPKIKAASSGLRKLSNKNRLSKALDVLAEQPSVKKDMWIKRAKEYEKNINSGDPAGGSNQQISWTLSTQVSVCMLGYDGSGGGGAGSLWNFGNPAFSISSSNADANGHGNFEYAVPSGYFALCSKNLAEIS